MSSDAHPTQHPLLACAQRIADALDEVAELDPGYLPTGAKAELLLATVSLEAKVASFKLRLLAVSADVAEADGARDPGAWLAARARTEAGAEHAAHRLADDLDRTWHRVAAGLRAGAVNLAQARVIVTALNALDPAVVDQVTLARAEQVLVDHAARFGPRELRRIGERILEVVAPTIAEEAERKKLEAEQARARAATRLDLRRRGDGSTDLHARIPDATASRLKAYLDAFASPRHDSSTSKGDRSETTPGGVPAAGLVDPATGRRLPADRIRGIAFVAFLEAADPHRMPIHGGDATTCVVTIDLKDLQAGTGPATLADGTRMSPGELRRLACTAAIIPAVLGTRSEVLDLGRTSRLFSRAQRRALALQHPECRTQGCTVPAAWCEAHHFRRPWARGGSTNLADGKLLCAYHHHCAHDETYQVDHLANGDVRFHKRT